NSRGYGFGTATSFQPGRWPSHLRCHRSVQQPLPAERRVVVVMNRADCSRAARYAQSSITPQRYCVWLSRANHTYSVARRSDYLALRFLAEDDLPLAAHFGTQSGDTIDKFADLATATGAGGYHCSPTARTGWSPAAARCSTREATTSAYPPKRSRPNTANHSRRCASPGPHARNRATATRDELIRPPNVPPLERSDTAGGLVMPPAATGSHTDQ
ncbi:flavin reductase, partial [Cryptosporangium sp. NPDC048952]|uniref:flavin reductase n=1 Tax=Cryptosporangium sp. NPDC048952 TaxID=3363961 RepID=UPI003710D5AE